MQLSSFLRPVGCEAGPSVASSWTLCSTRRALESLIAAVALVLSIPLMFVIALAVRLSSGGPILFRQRRMGRNGMEFTLYKFRSMKFKSIDAGPLITVRGDRRITAVGSFLRQYKLDELPQFWNVLRGDMSIVGPRPKLAHHEGLFLSARPGITGAATLAFRNEETLLAALPADQMDKVYETHFKAAKARLDAQYMREATFLSDCLIVWATIAACFFPGNTAIFSAEEPFESPLPEKATHWGPHIAHTAIASLESFESRKTPASNGNVAWQTSLILFCLVLTPVHICAQETPKATPSSGPDSRLDPKRPAVYHWASPNLALTASTPGVNVDTTGLQSGTYAVIVQVSQGPKAGKSTTSTTNFEVQDAGVRP
jgi:lipopolysaccharide/colanic/teichoic acid biosynthesis glycosyltransferase